MIVTITRQKIHTLRCVHVFSTKSSSMISNTSIYSPNIYFINSSYALCFGYGRKFLNRTIIKNLLDGTFDRVIAAKPKTISFYRIFIIYPTPTTGGFGNTLHSAFSLGVTYSKLTARLSCLIV
ncbi:unnamed protein product [Rhizophagus irregularis]|uniref:Uncharacterized protein n=1 Tax=Rhizophagus irregularis TaxID=588596 RepID=A0A915ZNI0_9GLOM|nr:unnamed protein product [Rhizophagus irregularis]